MAALDTPLDTLGRVRVGHYWTPLDTPAELGKLFIGHHWTPLDTLVACNRWTPPPPPWNRGGVSDRWVGHFLILNNIGHFLILVGWRIKINLCSLGEMGNALVHD